MIFAIASGRVFSVGLAGATKYPAALVGFPVAVACWLYRPRLRQQALWTAGAVCLSGLRFDLALLRDRRAKRVAGFGVDGESPFGLCRGQGGYSILALLFAIWLVLWNKFVGFGDGLGDLSHGARGMGPSRGLCRIFFLLMAAESVFMRYALPLSRMVAMLLVRPLVALRPLIAYWLLWL